MKYLFLLSALSLVGCNVQEDQNDIDRQTCAASPIVYGDKVTAKSGFYSKTVMIAIHKTVYSVHAKLPDGTIVRFDCGSLVQK